MKTIITLFAAFALCFLMDTSVYSADAKPHAIKGAIKDLGEATITVTKKGDHDAVYKTNDETTYDIDGKEAALADLKVGMFILLQNNKDVAVKVWASETNKRVGPSKK